MKTCKITEAGTYLVASINTLNTLANNGEYRCFRQDYLDAPMGVEKGK